MSENDEPLANSADARGSDNEAERFHQVTGALGEPQSGALTILNSEEDARRKELLEWAVKYAQHGWRVIPVRWLAPDGTCACPRGADCASPAKHPVHDDWPEVSTCDPLEVANWWRPEPSEGIAREWFPYANIGVVTGTKSNIFVLDVDTYAGGSQTLAAYERRNGDLPETRVHSTGRGGTHYIWQHPGFDVRNSSKKVLGRGLDIRGENGFIVMPPSVSAGGPYELNPAHDIDPAPAPEWFLGILRDYNKGQNGSSISGSTPSEATGAARRYAEAAVAAEAERMRDAQEGERNDTLNQCAFSLGTLGGAGLLSEEAAFAALREAALAAGLGETEIRGTFLSGWRSGLENPRQVQWRSLDTEWPTRPRTEFGLADRMADHYGDILRWCPQLGTWMTYQDGVWRTDTKQVAEWYAQAMIRRLEDTEADSYDDTPELAPDGTELPSARSMFVEWVGKQQTRKAVTVAAALAMGVPLMRMGQSTFDASPLMLNVRNGVVDLTTGELMRHSPEQRMTLQAGASYLPEEAPQWEEFLRRVQPDPETRAYLQRVVGYCATGLTTEQVFFLFHGSGANGKGVFQSVLSRVLGTYSQTVPVETLMASSVDGRIPNDVARMAGRRFLVASETKAGKALDEQRIKQLTGGDTIAARYMRAEWFEFTPVGKIQLTTNHLPKLSDDSATWRRIHLITWPVEIPEAERDGFLQQRLLEEESAGILRWIVTGTLAWLDEGLNPPKAVYDAREAYQRNEDVVGQFVEECLDIVPPLNGAIGRDTRTIWNAYSQWARSEGHPHMGQRTLTSRLGKKKFRYVRSNGWTGFPELQLKVFGSAEGDSSA
jgi:putative DNA primase/helicase